MCSIYDLALDAVESGLDIDSKILNITHYDLDGLISTSNIFKFSEDHVNNVEVFYCGYDQVDNIVNGMIDTPLKSEFKNFDFVLITDISVSGDVARKFQDTNHTKFYILDHHETAFPVNKYPQCHVDESGKKCGSEVTLDFLKLVCELTHNKKKRKEMDALDKLNEIATDYDLWFWVKKETIKVHELLDPTSTPDMLNRLFYTYQWKQKRQFAERWMHGWGKGFTDDEKALLDKEFINAAEYIQTLNFLELTENIGFVVATDFLNDVSGNMRHKWEVALIYNTERNKFSGRLTESSELHIGNIFKEISEKHGCRGGGHAKAGGLNDIPFDKKELVLEDLIDIIETQLEEQSS
jgi:oligoribonuclease NrnB/cAMP/cGMP phosphodiesterase (DHH superfamily)